MRGQEFLGLCRPVAQRIFGWHAERVKGVNVTARGQDLRAADQIAARDRSDETAPERPQEGRGFAILRQLRLDLCALGRIHRRQKVKVSGPRRGGHRAAHDMHPVGDQRIFGLEQFQPQGGRLLPAHIDQCGLLGNQRLKIRALGRDRRQCAPAGQAVFQLDQALVKPGLGQGWGQVCDGDGV